MQSVTPPANTAPDADGLVARAAFLVGVAVGSAAELLLLPYRLLTESSEQEPRAEPRAPSRLTSGGRQQRGNKGGESTRSARTSAVGRSVGEAPVSHSAAARLAQEQGQPALARALSDPDPSVRRLALRTVGEFSGDRAAHLLTEMLHDPDPGVRSAAAAAAARTRASGVVFSLILAIDDPARDVREASRLAFEEITGKTLDPRAGDDSAARAQLVEELKQWWKEQRFAQLALEGAEESPP